MKKFGEKLDFLISTHQEVILQMCPMDYYCYWLQLFIYIGFKYLKHKRYGRNTIRNEPHRGS